MIILRSIYSILCVDTLHASKQDQANAIGALLTATLSHFRASISSRGRCSSSSCRAAGSRY
ncbi:hypothetical protein E4K65_11570 [Bradyrhizobium niftali]|uniref:Uncharacterized protein n=1 Tax=Bradyrhizobium niftali TaxID=2560055 RepID=A0A4Y9M0X5_9BRAD|nr:hypothetical protein E4K65_11570 [Bradyrhizobium niftali]